jgi:dipeptidyl aminopeptidase/acylaminoacyl peptidase
MPTRSDSHVPVGKCIDYLEGRKDIDPDRIALYGASLGGVYSARAAAFDHRVKCVVSDSLVFDLHEHMLDRTKTPDALIWMHLKWVFGAETMEGVVEKCAAFNLDPILGKIACPYLIVQGAHDFLGLGVTDNAAASARAKGVQVTYKIFSAEETGASHCQVDNPTLGQEFICDWIAEQLRVDERQLADIGICLCP